jgi:hypothetical protein
VQQRGRSAFLGVAQDSVGQSGRCLEALALHQLVVVEDNGLLHEVWTRRARGAFRND